MDDNSHFLRSLGTDLGNRGEKYYGQRCLEIATSIDRLQNETIKVSLHCAALIQLMRERGISDESIKQVAIDLLNTDK